MYDVHAADAGEFSVTAVSGFGNVTSSTSLTVRGQSGFLGSTSSLLFFVSYGTTLHNNKTKT